MAGMMSMRHDGLIKAHDLDKASYLKSSRAGAVASDDSRCHSNDKTRFLHDRAHCLVPVSYTHLTLPTIYSV